jgi:MFS transporter, YNFM family, putative membrane transport protein
VRTEQNAAAVWVRMDKTTAAVMLAGMCTFLNVYPTQPLLPYFRQLFHASELAVSLTVSATVFAVALAAPFVGVIAERMGRKRLIVPSLLLLTLPTALCGSARSLEALIGWRFLQGVFVPGVIAVMLAYIVEEWEGRGVGKAMAAYVSGTVMGGFMGRFLSGLITTHWNWRAAFVVLGALNLVGALAVRAWLLTRFVPAEHMGHALAEARRHLRNPRLLANFGMGAAILFAMVGCFTYASFYLAAPPFRLNAAQLGSIFFVYLVGVVVTPMSGKFLDRYGFRHTAYLYCGMMMAGLVLTLIRSLPVVIAGLAIFSSGVFTAQAAATVETGAIAGRARSSAAGLYVTFYYLGGGLGATVIGCLWERAQWRGCVAALGAVAVVSLGLALLSSRGDQLYGEEAEIVAD